jgi:hypothetical protein
MDRKEFIRSSARWMIFGALVVLAGALAKRNRISTKKDACRFSSGLCTDCASLSSCSLPEAVKFRNDEKIKGI